MALTKDEAEDLKRRALEFHRRLRGKIEVVAKEPLHRPEDLSLAYTPGVAEPCLEIQRDPSLAYTYTAKSNLVAIVTDGTAVLGLGDIGPTAALPVMEGKALLFKMFAGVDAVPICLDTKDVDRIVETVKMLEPSFGGVNLEDISAPRCFLVESRLKQELDIPVFHDDQHGTAIVALAALFNALEVVGKDLKSVQVVISGAGAAGMAIAHLLHSLQVGDIIMVDRAGAIYEGRQEAMNPFKAEVASFTNRERRRGTLHEVVRGADVFMGVSGPGVMGGEDVARMARKPIIMAMANPIPEIDPDEARGAGAAVVATGRSDFPNQINNVLAFPGVFRGALDVHARQITRSMEVAAARALAALVLPEELGPEKVIPSPWNREVAPQVAAAVARAALEEGVNRQTVDPLQVAERTRRLVHRAAQVWNGAEGNGVDGV
ncbi:MAG: malic enzyme-like NAD(P)-binding protein [Bacillota bacterium]|nr:malic enzyme-like NAD(P)-binding protein [Bacillota bacterium]